MFNQAQTELKSQSYHLLVLLAWKLSVPLQQMKVIMPISYECSMNGKWDDSCRTLDKTPGT